MQLNQVATATPPPSTHSVARAPAPAPRVPPPTQTELASAHLTPRSRRLLPDALLGARVGRSTLAGSLNDQVRFRVDRRGPVEEWQVQPDSPTAAALVQSQAGPELLRQLQTAVRSTGHLDEVSNLKGFILAEDEESVLAGRVLSWLDDPDDADGRRLAQLAREGRTQEAGQLMRSWGRGLRENVARAGAWNSEGWITFMPDIARGMLVGAGAYEPHPTRESRLLDAERMTSYLSGNGPHEVQHSVSDPSPTAYRGPARWIEEGTANVFSRTPALQAINARRSNLLPHVYAERLRADKAFDPGWKPWSRPVLPPSKQKDHDKDAARNYGDSQVVLRDLVRLAGADFRSTAGRERAFELLQRRSMRFTPGVLADAIIERHGLGASVRERLRQRIKVAVDIPGGVPALAREFGIA